MVEMALAMGAVGVGLVSIMALFPVGINANRDNIANSYAADSVDEFMNFYANHVKQSGGNWALFAQNLPDAKDTTTPDTNVAWVAVPNSPFSHSPSYQFWKVEQQTPGTGFVEFSAVYRLWRSSPSVKYYDHGSSSWIETSIDSTKAIVLNVEACWPMLAPYANRRKQLFYLEVFNPN